jgi:hypothetical protein
VWAVVIPIALLAIRNRPADLGQQIDGQPAPPAGHQPTAGATRSVALRTPYFWVLAGDSGGAPEAVRHGETGYVIDSRSPREAAARLIELLTNPSAARTMGEKGRHWVHTEWSWQTSYQQLARLLDGTAPGTAPPEPPMAHGTGQEP